ncbi:MAG: GtrA family protein [Bacteroidales bacterium]|jgi:putative flippase GtrA|nr:GtrA family protein [Bacteroidales bacterium]
MILRLLKSFIKLFWQIDSKFLRFLFVGALNTAVSYLLFIFFIWIGLHYGWALLAANIIGVIWNYKTTGVLVFESHNNRLIAKFFLLYAVLYGLNYIELTLLDNSNLYEWILDSHYLDFLKQLPLNQNKIGDVIGQTIVTLPNALLSFFMMRTFIFKAKKEDPKA